MKLILYLIIIILILSNIDLINSSKEVSLPSIYNNNPDQKEKEKEIKSILSNVSSKELNEINGKLSINNNENIKLIYEDEIKKVEKMQDYNEEIVNTKCFKLDNIKIEEFQNQQHLILNEKNGNTLKLIKSDEIKNHIKNNLDWRFLNGKWGCVDSYSHYHYTNFNTFGGSITEFIFGLHVFQDNSGNQRIDNDHDLIYQLMKKYLLLNHSKYLIYHSNQVIYNNLKNSIFKIYPELNLVSFDIYHIDKEYQNEILRLIVQDEFIGCEFIKNIILGNGNTSSSLKSISPILVKNVIQSFFKLIWNDKDWISNCLFEIDDHNDMVALFEIKINKPFICGGPEIYPFFTQRLENNRNINISVSSSLNSSNSSSNIDDHDDDDDDDEITHRNYYVIQNDHQINRGIRNSIIKFLYDEFLCDDHHKILHRNKRLLSFDDFYENVQNIATIYKNAGIKMLQKEYKPKFDITINVLIPDELPKLQNKQIKLDNTTSITTDDNDDEKEEEEEEEEGKDNNNNEKSKIQSIFSIIFIFLGIIIGFAVIIFIIVSYIKKKEKYKYHTKLNQHVFSLEEDLEEEFDL